MVSPSPDWLSYRELLRRQSIHAMRESEVPSEHAISLGLPTRRWLRPGYAFFASPAVRRPGTPPRQHPPDRWWVLDARTGHLIVYALAVAIPFTDAAGWEVVTLPDLSLDVYEQRDRHARLAELMDRVAPSFFRGESGSVDDRKGLADALAALIPGSLTPQYRALVPEFFSWLDVG